MPAAAPKWVPRAKPLVVSVHFGSCGEVERKRRPEPTPGPRPLDGCGAGGALLLRRLAGANAGALPAQPEFLLGDRIQHTALDVLEHLIEATYTRRRGGWHCKVSLDTKMTLRCRCAAAMR